MVQLSLKYDERYSTYLLTACGTVLSLTTLPSLCEEMIQTQPKNRNPDSNPPQTAAAVADDHLNKVFYSILRKSLYLSAYYYLSKKTHLIPQKQCCLQNKSSIKMLFLTKSK